MGTKLLDNRIDPEDVLRGTLESKRITARPAKMPIGVDWPEEIYTSPERVWGFIIDKHEYPVSEVSLEMVNPSVSGTLRFAIAAEDSRAELELELFEQVDIQNYRFVVSGDRRVYVRRGEKAVGEHASSFFYNDPPVIWFSDGSSLEGNQYVELKNVYPPYDPAKIETWDWTAVNIRKESQGVRRDADSIQAKVIRELMPRGYHVIFDDDGKGEAADVVAVRLLGQINAPSSIDVEFYHCKYSHGDLPGHRIEDLYEVCGQAQKSISWMSSSEKRTDLFAHLLRREARRQEIYGASRYEVGNIDLLQTIREMSHLCPVSLKIFIVQPGVSKANVSREQLELLSVSEHYLMETFQLRFGVIASP
jgi:hypothetical protein